VWIDPKKLKAPREIKTVQSILLKWVKFNIEFCIYKKQITKVKHLIDFLLFAFFIFSNYSDPGGDPGGVSIFIIELLFSKLTSG